MALPQLTSMFVKILKLVLNIIIICIYRWGNGGHFLGASYRGYLDDGNIDAEILMSGVAVGYLVYTVCVMICICFRSQDMEKSPLDILMNAVGVFLWLAAGGVTIQFWMSFNAKHRDQADANKSLVDTGIALGSLAIIQGGIYIVDTILSFVIHRSEESE